MKYIELTQGKQAIVDDIDYNLLDSFKWCFSHGYATRTDSNSKKVYMHRVIRDSPKGYVTDHINRDRLDNRRSNLRTVTRTMNNLNRSPESNNYSKIKNIYWDKNSSKWRVKIGLGYKTIHLGRFIDINDAKIALAGWRDKLNG